MKFYRPTMLTKATTRYVYGKPRHSWQSSNISSFHPQSGKDSQEEIGGKNIDPSSNVHPQPSGHIPGPKSLPFLGTVFKYLPGGEYDIKKFYETSMKKFRKFGPIVRDEILPGEVVVQLFDPEDIRTLFKYDGKYPRRQPIPALLKYTTERRLTKGLIISDGEEWLRYRTNLQQYLMKRENVEAYTSAQDKVALDFVQLMRHKLKKNAAEGTLTIPDYLEDLYRWSLEMIGVLCFDSRLGVLNTELSRQSDEWRFIEQVGELFETNHQMLFFWPIHKHGTGTYRKFVKAMDYTRRMVAKKIDESIENSRKGGGLLMRENGGERMTLIDHMRSKANFIPDELVSMTHNLFVAAVDSTAHTLAFNLYLLAKNVDKQEKLYREICQFAPQLPSQEPITPEALRNMAFLKAVVKETFRLMPVAPIVSRVTNQEVKIRDYKIPSGCQMWVNTAVTGRSPDLFEEPERFIPERWLRSKGGAETSGPARPIHPFAVLPFGYGARSCIGRRLAEQELYLTLVRILQNFRLEYDRGEIGMVHRTFQKPDKPLLFTFVERSL